MGSVKSPTDPFKNTFVLIERENYFRVLLTAHLFVRLPNPQVTRYPGILGG